MNKNPKTRRYPYSPSHRNIKTNQTQQSRQGTGSIISTVKTYLNDFRRELSNFMQTLRAKPVDPSSKSQSFSTVNYIVKPSAESIPVETVSSRPIIPDQIQTKGTVSSRPIIPDQIQIREIPSSSNDPVVPDLVSAPLERLGKTLEIQDHTNEKQEEPKTIRSSFNPVWEARKIKGEDLTPVEMNETLRMAKLFQIRNEDYIHTVASEDRQFPTTIESRFFTSKPPESMLGKSGTDNLLRLSQPDLFSASGSAAGGKNIEKYSAEAVKSLSDIQRQIEQLSKEIQEGLKV